MRILVTGGAGYIGSMAVRLLLDAGYEVSVIDTLEVGHAEAIDPRANLTVGDVGDPIAVAAALEGCSAVIHFAGYALVAESQVYPEKYFDNNVTRPTRMLDVMVEKGVRDIVFSSTCAVYGEPATTPILEDFPKNPINAYGASKLEYEAVLRRYQKEHGIRPLCLRYFNVAGAWPDGSLGEDHDPESHIIPRTLLAARADGTVFEIFGSDYPTPDGTNVRDYIHVIDLVEAHRLAIEYLAKGGEPQAINLGTGTGSSNLEVVGACREVTGLDIQVKMGPRRDGDPAILVASSEKATQVLGWRPERPLAQAVADAWRWHQSHPDGYGS